MTLVIPEWEVGDPVKYRPFKVSIPAIDFTRGEVVKVAATDKVQVRMLVNGKTYWLRKDHLSNATYKGPRSRYIKLLKRIRFGSFGQDIICPPNRCLEVVSEDDKGVYVNIEEGAGHTYFHKTDKRIVWATQDDLCNEPDDNEYESHR